MLEPITPERLAEIRKQWTGGVMGAQTVFELLAEVDHLRARLDAPCGSCHPCTNYVDETWRAAGRTPPHVVEWDEVRAEVERLRSENKRLRLDAERDEQTIGNLIDERDNFHALLDRFAAAVAPIEVIGEHSSGNDPWVNALDMVTPAAEVDRFRSVAYTQASMISELTSACMTAETERDRLKAELAEMESAVSRVRTLHAEVPYRPGYCYCANPCPCPTVRTLDGDGEGGEPRG